MNTPRAWTWNWPTSEDVTCVVAIAIPLRPRDRRRRGASTHGAVRGAFRLAAQGGAVPEVAGGAIEARLVGGEPVDRVRESHGFAEAADVAELVEDEGRNIRIGGHAPEGDARPETFGLLQGRQIAESTVDRFAPAP